MNTTPEHRHEHPVNDREEGFMNAYEGEPVNTPAEDTAADAVNGGTVVPFRTARRAEDIPPARARRAPGTALVPDDSVEGEVVDDAPRMVAPRAVGDLITGAEVRRSREVAARFGHLAWLATKVTGRCALRQGIYAYQGSKIRRAERRARRKHTELEQAIKTLRVNATKAEDFAYLRELEDALERRQTGRLERRRIAREEFLHYAKYGLIGTTAIHAGILVYSLGDTIFGDGSVVATAEGIGEFWTTVAYWSPAGPYCWGWLLGGIAWWASRVIPVGRERGELPRWATPGAPGEATGRDVVPDEGAIINALRNLNLPAMNAKFREGWTPRWVQGSSHDGKGWRTQLLLPEGVTVGMIVDRKDVLAHNLLRLPVEVWPTEPKDSPGVLDLWVADQGSLTKPVEPWPLLHEGTTDYFKGVPVAVNPQGKTVIGKLFQANWGVAGMMGSGKSTLIITMLLGAMLDPLVEIDVYCMAFNADYDPLKPRLRTLFKSDEPDEIPVVLDALRKLMSELSERGRILSEAGEPKLTRKLAEADPRMRPRVVVIDECQELFVSEVGDEAAELVEKIVAKARKYGVTLVFATPVPSADSLPRKVAKVLSNKACFAIGDHQGNDAILGTGKHKAGISATTLRPMTEDADGTVDPGDIGTAMTVGFMAMDGLMRCYYPRRGNGVDEVTPVVQRALALREGIEPAAPDTPGEAAPEADPLADIAAVLGHERKMRTQTVLQRLIERDRGAYGGWTLEKLRAVLAEHDAAPYKSRGVMNVSAELVHAALTERDGDADEADPGD
jgi:S-DNA-T family DNA segregation ATPase FtsK/SpoIIIE